jgi:hypothetical protein
MSGTLRLADFSRSRDRFAYTAEIRGHRFTTSFRYDTVDLDRLEEVHGAERMRSIYFHAIAFDINRLVSLEPKRVDFGEFRDQVTPEFATLWRQIFEGVWAQWRYENDAPDYRGPEIVNPLRQKLAVARPPAFEGVARDRARSLVFCGGGKDSLLAAKLFEEIEEPFDSFAYSHSIYGEAEHQHRLIDGLLDHCAQQRRHRLWIEDEFLRKPPFDPSDFGVRTFTSAETPSGLFASLPLALADGFEHLVVAHEKSADTGNLVWEATGEEINHQWGKSLEAEALLDEYVGRHLLPRTRYFSVLKSVQDAVIFPALNEYLEAIPSTHSCNESKPWCRRCAKCVYVWLGYAAYLPRETVMATFGENLFDVERNLPWFARLLGLEEHLPFECVGQVTESLLALVLAARGGWSGRTIERFAGEAEGCFEKGDLHSLFAVASNPHRIPRLLAGRVVPALELHARQAREAVVSELAGHS